MTPKGLRTEGVFCLLSQGFWVLQTKLWGFQLENKTSLIALSHEFMRVMELIEESDGEFTPDQELVLDEISKKLVEKADNYHGFMKWLESQETLFKSEAERIKLVAKSYAKLQDRMETNIKTAMRNMGMDRLEGETIAYTLYKSPGRLVIEDESKVHPGYKMIQYVPDKERIKDDLKLGIPIEGCKLEISDVLKPVRSIKRNDK